MSLRITTRYISALLLILCFYFFPDLSEIRADGVIVNSHNAIAAGRGGTNGAHWDNGGIVLDNPAGMVHMNQQRYLEVGFSFLYNDIEYRDPVDAPRKGETHFPENPALLPYLSYIEKINDRLAIGGGIFAPAGLGTNITHTNSTLGESKYQSFAAMIKVTPAISVKLNEKISVGGGIGIGIGHANIRGPFAFQSGGLIGQTADFEVKGDDISPVWRIGFHFQPIENVYVGLTYTGQTKFDLEGDAYAMIPVLGNLQSSFSSSTEITFPRHLRLGIRTEIRQSHQLSLEASWYDWSSGFRDLQITLTNPTAPLPPSITDTLPLSWQDSVSVRVGYDWHINENNTLRMGFATQQSVSPSDTLTSYIPAVLKHHVTVGYSVSLMRDEISETPSEWRLHLAYAYWFGQQSVGTSRLAGGDFSGSRIRNSYHNLLMGISYLQ